MSGFAESWACFAGTEIWSSDRTYAYLSHGLAPAGVDVANCSGCPGVGLAVEDAGFSGYKTPEEDGAAWYDPAVPESADFAGLLVTKVTGFDSPYERELITTINGGGALGPLRIRPRTILVQGLLMGRTCCSVNYGKRWLISALAGPQDCVTCTPDEFTFLTCCPDAGGSSCTPGTPDHEPETDRFDSFFRSTCNAGLLSGPTVTNELGFGCGCGGCVALEVEFSLGMGPYLFSDPVLCMDAELFDLDEEAVICVAEFEACDPLEVVEVCPDCGADITFVAGTNCPECDACAEPEPCLDDPLCAIPSPPPAPPLLAPLCSDLYCQPAFVARLVCEVDASNMRAWSDAVVSVEIHAGSESLRNLSVMVFPNPLGLDPDNFAPCDACGGFFVSFVPCDSVLRLDGACQQATIECSGVVVNAERNLAAIDGTTFSWPVLTCGPWIIVFDADPANTAPDATVTVMVIGREA